MQGMKQTVRCRQQSAIDKMIRCTILAAYFLQLLVAPLTTVSGFTVVHYPCGMVARRHRYQLVSSNNKSEQDPLFTLFATGDDKEEYSRELLLREEAESPFRKVRFFVYFALGGGALTSLLVSLARVAAGLNGINEDLLPESLTNAGVDLAGIVVLAFLYKRDLEAEESRLKRASKGAELAKLMVIDSDSSQTIPLASYRRGRGIEKRVVIVAGSEEKIEQVMKDAKELEVALSFNDLLIVPVILPQATAPKAEVIPECVAVPVGKSWKTVMDSETEEARKQGVDIERDGYCVILKKNGRIGQRTKGIFLENMVGEVTERRNMGMDVTNI